MRSSGQGSAGFGTTCFYSPPISLVQCPTLSILSTVDHSLEENIVAFSLLTSSFLLSPLLFSSQNSSPLRITYLAFQQQHTHTHTHKSTSTHFLKALRAFAFNRTPTHTSSSQHIHPFSILSFSFPSSNKMPTSKHWSDEVSVMKYPNPNHPQPSHSLSSWPSP